MFISKATIKDYRTFVGSMEVNFDKYAVIIGPNNIGKSNILRAIELFFTARPRLSPTMPICGKWRTFFRNKPYESETDFPIQLAQRPRKQTSITLEFRLEQKDINPNPSPLDETEILDSTKFHPGQTISVQLELQMKREEVRCAYKCKNIPQLDSDYFVRWLFRHSKFIRMSTGRDFSAAQNLMKTFGESIWARLYTSYKVTKALSDLRTRAEKELHNAERELKKTLPVFLPELNKISFELKELPAIADMLSINDIKIDDGTFTSLANKGDGVQSLFFMGLLQFIASQKAYSNLLIGIEEPEVHLHPNAQEELGRTLQQLASKTQIIITTHSPILVDKYNIASNIIVSARGKYRAQNARSLKPIREILGVRPSHNLQNAELVVLVEGESDKVLLAALLPLLDSRIKTWLSNGTLAIWHGKGTEGISELVKPFCRQAQPLIVLVDNDEAGRKVFEESKQDVPQQNLFMVPLRQGTSSTEMEDLFPLSITRDVLNSSYVMSITEADIVAAHKETGNKHHKPEKWSCGIELLLNKNGKGTLSDDDWVKLKTQFANAAIKQIRRKEDVPVLFANISNSIIDFLSKTKSSR